MSDGRRVALKLIKSELAEVRTLFDLLKDAYHARMIDKIIREVDKMSQAELPEPGAH